MTKCDLHIHSNFSDGKYSVEEILEEASKIGCTTISIVDHNNCEAYEYLKKIRNSEIFRGKIISGCEFNTFYDHIPIELLGYDFDPKILKEHLKNLYRYSMEDIKRIEQTLFIEQCRANKIQIAADKLQIGEKEHSSSYLYRCLTYYQENVKYFETLEDFNNPLIFYRKYMSNPNSIFFCNIESYYPSPLDVVIAIKKSGGKVFIPHIFEYKNNAKKILNGLISSVDIDGVECYYSKFTLDQRKRISEFADNNKLLKSGGSDCHSGKHIKIGIGRGDLDISNEMLGAWIDEARDFNIERGENER